METKILPACPLCSFFKTNGLRLIVLACITVVFMGFRFLVMPTPPPGKTGSPFDGESCLECHDANTGSGTYSVTSNIPGTGYVPGASYDITVTIAQGGISKYQFQLSPHSATGAKLGNLTANATTQILGTAPQYISAAESALATGSWTFQWTAPAASTGDVTFYAAIMASNSDDDISGDFVYLTTYTVSETSLLPLSSSISGSVDLACNAVCSGSATVSATGGSTPYTYLWSDGSGQSTATATGLCAGSYSVTVSDATPGTSVSTVIITEPDAISSSFTQTPDDGTSNGTATVLATGGTTPYSYLWNTTPPQSTPTATGLASGSVSVTVTDANNCTETGSITVVLEGALYGSIAGTNLSCNSVCVGTATVTAIDGTSPYTYLWSNGATTDSISGLCAGLYSVTITDSVSGVFSINITISEPTAITTAMDSTADDGTGNGTATVTASGGIPPYTYLWSNGQSTSTATGLTAGTITVMVMDSANCMVNDSVDVLLGISNSGIQSSVKVFPNPNNGEFSIEIYSKNNDYIQLSVLDVKGQQVFQEKLQISSGKNILPVFIGTERKGMYIIQLVSNDDVVHFPVTLVR